MRLGTIIHGVLLAAMLLFAYQTWTRTDKPDSHTGNVKVWDTPAASIAAIVFQETDKREVRVERRAAGNESYLWAIEKRFTPKTKKKPPAPKDGEEPAEPEDDEDAEIITHTREYAVGDEGDTMLEQFAKLRALHDLGEVTDIAAQEYGLEETTKYITVELDGGATKKLLLGDKVQGGSNRYVLDTESNHGYVLAAAVVGDIESGEPKLKLKNLHAFKDEVLAGIELKSGSSVRRLSRIETKDDKGTVQKTWADETDPGKPNQTMANFVKRLGDLTPSQFETELTTEGLELLLMATYHNSAGASIGTLELYKKVTEPEPEPEPDPAPDDDADGDGANTPDGANKPDDKADGAKKPDDKADGADKPEDADKAPEPPKIDKPKPKPKPKTEYYIRTQRTRVLATVSAAVAERVDADLPTIFE